MSALETRASQHRLWHHLCAVAALAIGVGLLFCASRALATI